MIKNTNKKRNITSPLRSGFDYQNLWTLKLCGEWLLDPDKYKWIQIEANPTEEDFFLDDIILLDKDDKYCFYQIKFKVDKNYSWTWDDLLKSKKSKKDSSKLPSLLKKWATSIKGISLKEISKAYFITNGNFSKEIKQYLSDDLINIEKLKKNTELYKKIKKEFENENQLIEFFSIFKFVYENKKLNKIENEVIEKLFINVIKATDNGVRRLRDYIRVEAQKTYTVQLKFEQVKRWCEIDDPQPLNESFEIPNDFQFFDEISHISILKDLKKSDGGIKLIHGKPGTGKSVYLSQLSKILKEQNIVVIKHHYHINPSENNIYERLNAKRVIEATKAQFEINGLNKKAVSKIIDRNQAKLTLPEEEKQKKELKEKIFNITKGNPLYLRYVLQQLKNSHKNTLITEYFCRDLIQYDKNIENYYSTLWNTLDDSIKSFLLTFVSVDFKFTNEQFFECISSFVDPAKINISESFKKVEHLIVSDFRNKLRIYHDSFKVFLHNTKEWLEQEQVIKKSIKTWLEKSSYENLKWAELRKIEYCLGNNEPILKIDRNWLIGATVNPRNYGQIKSQLKLATKVAMENKDFSKALQISHLGTYYENANDFVEEASKLIWIEAIKLNPEFVDDLNLKELPSDVLVVISNIAEQKCKQYIIDNIINILQDRLSNQEYREGEIPNATEAIIKVMPYNRKHEVKRVFEYIIQFRDLKISQHLFQTYGKQLLQLDQKTKMNELLNLDLMENEREAVLGNCVISDFEKQKTEYINLVIQQKNPSLFEQIYLVLHGEKISELPQLRKIADFPETIKEYGGERNLWIENFYSFFNLGLIYALSGRKDVLEKWIKQASGRTQWSIKATIKLFTIAQKISKTIQTEKKIDYKDVFSELNDLENLLWSDDRDKVEFKHALTGALTNIFKDSVLFKKFLGDSVKISIEDYQIITGSPFFSQQNLFNFVLDLGEQILEKEVFLKISNEKIKGLSESINYFSERAEDYAKLTKFNSIYQELKTAKELLINAADNLLGYGYHKDIYLFDVLEAIEFCAESGVEKDVINDWTQRIIPIIEHIGECTDGDETHNLSAYLADFLSKYNKKLLFKFYFSQAKKEELYPAQETFKYVIKSLSFKSDKEIALATTALDKDSLGTLKDKAKLIIGAEQSLSIIQDYLGEIKYKERDGESSHHFEEKKEDFSKIQPEKLEKHLNHLKTKWDFEKYIIGWTRLWLDKKNKQDIYSLIKSISFKNTDIKSVSGELLDILYPLAYEFENGKAFEYLCFAQINDHGWSRYWTDKKKAISRWKFLKEKYPSRYLEFFEKSREDGFPLSRGVEYLLFFDDVEKAKEITESSLSFAEQLMANLKLSKPDWAEIKFSNLDEIDLLFQRLVWPSPLVRERAATAIGNLIAFSPQNHDIYSRLLEWIQKWKIESIIAMGLLPVIKAFQLQSDTKKISFIDITNIVNSVQANSIVIEKILVEIAGGTKQKLKKLPKYLSANKYLEPYKPKDFFEKYIKTILAPIYHDRANEIEEKTGIPFMKLWSYNAEEIAKIESIELNPNNYFYGHSKNDKFLIGFSTKVSEIYRSAFLRVLYSIKKLIPYNFYLEYSLATLPIDFSFWRIDSNRMPGYWPKFKNAKTSDTTKKDISLIKFETSIDTLIKHKENNFVIIGASGAICPGTGWDESPLHSFSLIGFAYRVVGKNLPAPEEVSQKILWNPQTIILPTRAKKPLNFLENHPYFDIHSEPIQIKDLMLFPLITRNRDMTISFWQYYKDKNQSFNIIDELRNDLEIKIKQNHWAYVNKENNEIIVFKDWLEGLQERYEFEIPIPHGQQVLINDKFLNKVLKENNLRLGFLLKTTFRDKSYSYDEIKKADSFELLNVSNIII